MERYGPWIGALTVLGGTLVVVAAALASAY